MDTIKIGGKIDSNNAAEFEKRLLSAAGENYGISRLMQVNLNISHPQACVFF